MNALEILLSSSLISATISSFISIYLNNVNYKREYYKRLIQKRFEALEEVISLLNEFKILVNEEQGLINRAFASGEGLFTQILVKIAATANISFWLNKELSEKILHFNIFLINEISSKINKNNQSERDAQLKELGYKNHELVRQYRDEIEKILIKELNNLNKIKLFLESKKAQKEDYKLYKLYKEKALKN